MFFIEYQQAWLDVATTNSTSAKTDFERQIFDDVSFTSESVRFDNYCLYAFLNCMNRYNVYSQPLIRNDDFMNFMPLSKCIFPLQWEFLLSAWGINPRDNEDLVEYKVEHQVFVTLLNLQRMANFRTLKHWAMVISTAYYGWGTRKTIGNITSFIGTVASTESSKPVDK